MENYVYRIKPGILKTGDIILTNGDNSLSSESKKDKMTPKAIRKILGSDYSHVMIYLDGTCAHAVGKKGVEYFNISKYFIRSKDKIKVLRFKEVLSEKDKGKLERFIAERHGNEYDYFAASKSAFKLSLSNDINQQFCSKLVADAYEVIGIKIEEQISSQNINPKDIQECKKFKEVEIEFEKVLEDKAVEIINKKSRSLVEQTKSVNELRKKLQKIYSEYNLEFYNYQTTLFKDIPSQKNMPNFRIINKKIAEAIRQSGYDSFWKYDIDDNPEIYNLKVKKELYYSEERYEAIQNILGYTVLSMEAIGKEKHRLENLYQNSDLEVSYDLMKLFTKIINKHYSIIFTNFKVFDLLGVDYRLDEFPKFENTNFQKNRKIHLKNMKRIEKMISQGERLYERITRGRV